MDILIKVSLRTKMMYCCDFLIFLRRRDDRISRLLVHARELGGTIRRHDWNLAVVHPWCGNDCLTVKNRMGLRARCTWNGRSMTPCTFLFFLPLVKFVFSAASLRRRDNGFVKYPTQESLVLADRPFEIGGL